MIRAVVFDMDGVLVDSEPLHKLSEVETFARHGVRVTEAEISKFTGTTLKHSFKILVKKHRMTIAPERLRREHERYLLEVFGRKAAAPKGVIPLVKSFHRKGLKLAVASSAPRALVELILRKLGIRKYFCAIVTADDVGKSKPHPEIFLKAARKLRVKPSDCLAVEDATLGVESAKRAGMKCLGFASAHSTNQDVSDADFMTRDFSKISVEKLLSL